MNDEYADLYKRYLREAILLDGKDKKIFKADCNNEYHGHPDQKGESRTVLWGIAPLLRGDVFIVDTDPVKVHECRNLYRGIDIKVGDVRKLPYSDNLFDVVLDFSTLDHVPLKTWWRALKEYNRVLKEDGRIILIEWTQTDFLEDGNLVFYYNRKKLGNMVRNYFNIDREENFFAQGDLPDRQLTLYGGTKKCLETS